jgi:outer membrane protein assembly factor BamA
MNKIIIPFFLGLFLFCGFIVSAQKTPASFTNDSGRAVTQADTALYAKQLDLIDIGMKLFKKDRHKRIDHNAEAKKGKLHISAAPAFGFSSSTGFAVLVAGNSGFYLSDDKNQAISTVVSYVSYTANHQIIFPIQSSIFTKDNKYNFIGDWRYLQYPQDTYGLGSATSLSNGYKVNYDYIRFHQFALRSVHKHLYMGLGVQFDKHWNIREINPPVAVTDFDKYGFSNSSTSSGITANILYDSRLNQINPDNGSFVNALFRQNFHFLGSDQSWNSLIVDARKYFPVGQKNNVLALWSYNWLILDGHAPYLDLPATGWDTYNNTGRGYLQNRYKGNGYLDLEAEFRFGILNNGLLGGVVFANAESVENYPNNKFTTIFPAAGAGIRIKFNKFSKANVAFDYGIGTNGSHGFYVNLGEVF